MQIVVCAFGAPPVRVRELRLTLAASRGEIGHDAHPSGVAKPADASDERSGKGAETVLTGEGPVCIEVPRDRYGSSASLLIPKHERHLTGFDDKVVAMYA